MSERSLAFGCFGGQVEVRAEGGAMALASAAARLREIHLRLTCFEPDSELSRLNADPRPEVPASPLVRRLAAAARRAGELSGGLVDATASHPTGESGATSDRYIALTRPALPDPAAAWRLIEVDEHAGTVIRPPGVRIDSGGLAKGMAADIVGEMLSGHATWAADCAGDLRVGGTARRPRPIDVHDPHGGEPVARLRITDGAVATSGVTRRGAHILDPGRGAPACTGILQATALAPTGFEAEVRAKTALLAGPGAAPRHLPHGGVLVLSEGEVVHVAAATETRAAA